jgi:D-alanine-D-alanine ligase
MGGTSAEREVSLRSGKAVATALEQAGYETVALCFDSGPQAARALTEARLDVAFLALHGRLGEDGCVQGLLEMLQIPYTGSSVLASALAMDKLKAKELFRLYNIPTPPYYELCRGNTAADVEENHGSFGFPVIVKPRREGSSIGLGKARDLPELRAAVQRALEFDTSVLVERFIAAREVAVAVLDGRVLGAIEVVPKSGLYDYSAKYTPGQTEYHMPARLPPMRYRGVLNLAERAVQAVGASGAARVDVLVTEGQNEYVLEVNTSPGMTPTSLLPKIAEAAGYTFLDLCAALVERACLHTDARDLVADRAEAGPVPVFEALAQAV